jgi:predicted N-acetyltransferase YhbS
MTLSSVSAAVAEPAYAPASAVLQPERPIDAPQVESLIDRAFGPGRFAKTAERLREGREPVRDLSFCAWSDGVLVGCVRQWRILVGETPAIFLGPIAVESDQRRHGLGASLIEAAAAAAKAAGHGAIVLVGDAPYFGPLGFNAAPRLRMLGPVDARRLLVRALIPGGADALEGLIAPV